LSYVDDIYDHSTARKIREERDKIRVNLFDDNEKQKVELWCYICNRKMVFEDAGRKIHCRECGVTKPVEEAKRVKKLTSRFPSASGNPIIISQKDKKRELFRTTDTVNSDLDDETKQELRSYGYNI